MVVKMDLNIPPHFFDSANQANNFESVSERIAKSFICEIIGDINVHKGNPDAHEPDYISGSAGYEVTFAVARSLIPQLKGIKALTHDGFNIERALIEDISEAVERKAHKNYTIRPCLIIITISTLLSWYYPLFSEANGLGEIGWRAMAKNRDDFFDDLYSKYIQTGIFRNIMIIHPTHDEQFALFDIKNFGSYENNYLTKVGVKNKKAFPVCKTTNVEYGPFPIRYETTIIAYNKEEPLNGQAENAHAE